MPGKSIFQATSLLASRLNQMTEKLSPATQQALTVLTTHFPSAPATFTEQQIPALLQAHPHLQLRDLDQLVDDGLVSAVGRNRYQLHPAITAFVRLRS